MGNASNSARAEHGKSYLQLRRRKEIHLTKLEIGVIRADVITGTEHSFHHQSDAHSIKETKMLWDPIVLEEIRAIKYSHCPDESKLPLSITSSLLIPTHVLQSPVQHSVLCATIGYAFSHTAQPGESTGSNLKLIAQKLLVRRPRCLGTDILRLKISALYLVPCYLLPKIERALGIQSSSLALVVTWVKASEEHSPSAQVRRHPYHNLTEISPENHKQQTLKTGNTFACYHISENRAVSHLKSLAPLTTGL